MSWSKLVAEVAMLGELESIGESPELSVALGGCDIAVSEVVSAFIEPLIAIVGARGGSGTGSAATPLSRRLYVHSSCLAEHFPQGWPSSSHLILRVRH
jgi:hypothetical protein